MKKLYMEPATRVVTAQTTQFLMTSGGAHSSTQGIKYGGVGTGDEDVD
jgi:hypothetical protein